MNDHKRRALEQALEALRLEHAEQLEPPFEQLEAYVAGRLPEPEARALEQLLARRPDLREEVALMRDPDPGLTAAAWAGFQKGQRKAAAVDAPAPGSSSTLELHPALERRPAPIPRTADPSRWRRISRPVAVALMMVVALFVLWRPVPPGGEVTRASGSFAWETGLRAGAPVKRFPRGAQQPITLTPPKSMTQAILLEVAEREVSLLKEQPVLPGTPQRLTVVADGGPELSFLVIVYLERPFPGEALKAALEQVARSGGPLTSSDAGARETRILEAFRTLGAPPMSVDISNLYQIEE